MPEPEVWYDLKAARRLDALQGPTGKSRSVAAPALSIGTLARKAHSSRKALAMLSASGLVR